MRNQTPEHATRIYVARHFWRLSQLAAAAGLEEKEASHLIRAGCAPGPTYAWSGRWWSALSASRGIDAAEPPEGAEPFYSRSAAWDLRLARLSMRDGATAEAAADGNRDHFARRFVASLAEFEGAVEAFPSCWREGRFDPGAARIAAHKEWASWLQGAYGVCLRLFDARNCIAKETLAARLKRRIAAGAPPGELLDDAQALAALILPFAPSERASGTPGRTIDALLAQAGLGDDLPYC